MHANEGSDQVTAIFVSGFLVGTVLGGFLGFYFGYAEAMSDGDE